MTDRYERIDTALRSGVSLRDYFAAKALVGQIAAGEGKYVRGYDGWRDEFAREAYRYADAMLRAREATN